MLQVKLIMIYIINKILVLLKLPELPESKEYKK